MISIKINSDLYDDNKGFKGSVCKIKIKRSTASSPAYELARDEKKINIRLGYILVIP